MRGLDDLRRVTDRFFDAAYRVTQAGDKKAYTPNFLFLGAANRSISLIEAFCDSLEKRHVLAALSLVRLHLDTLLRLHSLWLVEDLNAHANKILAGERLDKIRSKENVKLTDRYLADTFATIHGAAWVKNVYAETSGFVHLSQKHIFFPFSIKDEEDRSFTFKITAEREIPEAELMESVEGMIEISRCILLLFEWWIKVKST